MVEVVHATKADEIIKLWIDNEILEQSAIGALVEHTGITVKEARALIELARPYKQDPQDPQAGLKDVK